MFPFHPILHQTKYIETSAKHKALVDTAFHGLIREIRKEQKPEVTKEGKKKKRCNMS